MADILYVDEAGNPIDDYDPEKYEIVSSVGVGPQLAPQEPEAGWFDTLSYIGIPAAVGISNAAAGGAQAIGDLTGMDFLSRWGSEQKQLGTALEGEVRNRLNLRPGSAKDITLSGGQLLPLVATGVAAPSIGAFIGTGAAQNFGERYADLKEQGATPLASGGGALGSAALNSLLDRFGFGAAFNPAKGPIRSVVESGVRGAIEEPIAETGDMFIDRIAAGTVPTPEQVNAMLKTSAVLGAVGPVATSAGRNLAAGSDASQRAAIREQFLESMRQNQPPAPEVDAPEGISMIMDEDAEALAGEVEAPAELPAEVLPEQTVEESPNIPEQEVDVAEPELLEEAIQMEVQEDLPVVDPLNTSEPDYYKSEKNEDEVNPFELNAAQKALAKINEDTITPSNKFRTRIEEWAEGVEKKLPPENKFADNARAKAIEKPFPSINNLVNQDPEQYSFMSDAQSSRLEQAAIPDIPIEEVELSSLKITKDAPSIKGDDPKPTDKWEQWGPDDAGLTGPILVWEREDGSREVASGRKRFNRAKKKGLDTFKVQIVKESDGYTAADVRRLDGEQNLKEGQLTTSQSLEFFLQNDYTHEEAKTKGLFRGMYDEDNWFLSKAGTDPLIKEAKNEGNHPTGWLKAIAIGAPKNELAQREALKRLKFDLSLKGGGSNSSEWYAAYAHHLHVSGKDNLLLAISEAEEVANTSANYREYYKKLSRLADIAEQESSIAELVGDPAEIRELAQTEYERWQKPEQHPDLIENIKNKKGPLGDGEGGFFVPDLLLTPYYVTRKAKQAVHDVGGAIQDFFSHEGRQSKFDKMPGSGRVIVDEGLSADHFLSGRLFGVENPLTRVYREKVIFPKTLADKFPEYDATFRTGMEIEKDAHRVTHDLMADLTPYVQLQDKKKVDEMLIATRIRAKEDGKRIDHSDRFLAGEGFSPDEIKAYRSVRTALDNALLIHFKDGLKAAARFDELPEQMQKAKEAEIDALISELYNENYVPFGRFGDMYVWSPEANHFSLHENRRDADRTIAELKARGFLVETGKVRDKKSEAYSISPALMAKIAQIDPRAAAEIEQLMPVSRGWTQHLEKARLVNGYSENIERSLAEYISGLGKYVAHKKAGPKWDEARQRIQSVELLKMHEKYRAYMESPGEEHPLIRQGLAYYYLGLNTKSAVLNLSQLITTTWPTLTVHVTGKKARNIMLQSSRESFDYITNKEKFAKENPKLFDALESAMRDGEIAAEQYRWVTGAARGKNKLDKKGMTFGDVWMGMFSGAERLTRTQAFIAGYHAGEAKGVSDPTDFASRFVEDTQFIYNRANRPEMARGHAAPLFVFRLFGGNYQRLFRNVITANPAAGVRMVAAMGMLGGMAAVPLYKELEKALEKSGYDPKSAVRDLIASMMPEAAQSVWEKYVPDGWLSSNLSETVSDVVLYGLPSLAGINISGAISTGELAPGAELGPEQAFARLVLGVAYDPVQRVGRAKWLAGEMGKPGRAFEALLPESARNFAVALRGYAEGFRAPDNEPYIKEPTGAEIVAKGLGFTPNRLAKAYEERNSFKLLDERARANKNINFKIADAILNQNRNYMKELLVELREHNQSAPPEEQIEISTQAIKGYILKATLPELARLKKLPKKARAEYLRRLVQRR